jgi:hypothetical protein
LNPDGTLCTTLHRQGHKGIISVEESSCPIETISTTLVSYSSPVFCTTQLTGKKEQLLQQQLYELASSQVEKEMSVPQPPLSDYTTSVYHSDFNSTNRATPNDQDEIAHDMNEESVTFWRHNVDSVTGVSQSLQLTSPFHRNSAFTMPVEYYLNQPKPHDNY